MARIAGVPLTVLDLTGGFGAAVAGASALTGAGDTNAAHARAPGLPASFVPGRNAVFLTHAAAFAQKIASMVLEKGLPERTLLNVNVPGGTPNGALVTVQGRREH